MPKTYICQNCGQDYPAWSGQCQSCGEWNTLVEEIQNPWPGRPKSLAGQAKIQSNLQFPMTQTQIPTPITEVDFKVEERYPTGIAELDRVLGGGVVAGSVVLVAGEPGIGKSTMMLQAAEALAQNFKVLYVSGEESAKQIRLRAERLGTLSKDLILYPETNLFAIEKVIDEIKPQFVVIDSIQTLYREDVASAPSSVSQVRECAAYLVRIAKASGISIFIVGHVTKEGTVAGPRVLEHIVDTVLYFEGEQHKQYRLLRATKNRFGSTNEIGIFEMKDKGLTEVINPSEVFLSERPKDASGSVVTAAIEGSRPLLVEIQALVADSKLAYPLRRVSGVDYNRVLTIIAVLERQVGLRLSDQDIYVNAAGGVKVMEPAMDLPIALAIASCFKGKPVDPEAIVFGEVGLVGEVRSVNQVEQRIKEAEKLGFKQIVVPRGNLKEASKAKIEIYPVSSVRESVKVNLG